MSEILGYLNIYDLNEVAGVCTGFKYHADESFLKRYNNKVFEIKIGYSEWEPASHEADILLRSIQSVLRKFGPLIHLLKVDCRTTDSHTHMQWVMKWIHEYCGETLTSMDLSRITLSANLITNLAPLLSQLEELKLHNCDIESELAAVDMFSYCHNIHTLQISGIEHFPICVKLPKLSILRIRNCKIYSNTLKYFLQVNRSLKEIEILGLNTTQGIMEQIATYIPHLEKLSFGQNTKVNLKDISLNIPRMTALTSLKIEFGGNSCSQHICEIVAARIPIQYFEIGKYKTDNALINEIGKFGQLSGLSLNENIEASDVLKIVTELSALTTLSVKMCKLTSAELLQWIRFAPKLKTLHFQLPVINLCLDAILYTEILNVVTSRDQKCPLEIRYPEEQIHRNCLKLKHELLQITKVISPPPTLEAFIAIG